MNCCLAFRVAPSGSSINLVTCLYMLVSLARVSSVYMIRIIIFGRLDSVN
jgi:hypothetical protein